MSVLCMAIMLMVTSLPAFATDFPGRAKYPAVKTISTEELSTAVKADSVVIVDVRSAIEYEVVHPVNAVHVAMSNVKFDEKISELRSKNGAKTIATYCNGITCLKSYEAVERAAAAGVTNIVAYDAGIPDWAVKFPDKTLLLGKLMSESKQSLISDAAHAARELSADDFKKAALADNAVLIDVRDTVQKSDIIPGLEKAKPLPIDLFISLFVTAKRDQDKKLLIFDQVGKQVVWLEYYLIENGYKDYAFLKGGAVAVTGSQEYKK